jgi:hypothetical protein
MPRKIKGNGNIFSRKNARIYLINNDDNNDDEYNDNVNNIPINDNNNNNNDIINKISPSSSLSSLSRSSSNKRKTKKHSTTLGNLNQVEHDRLLHILGNYGSDVAGLQMVLKRGFEPETMERMKKEKEKLNLEDPNFANMSISKMRKWCDELYIKLNQHGRYKRLSILIHLGELTPEEFPKRLIDDNGEPSRYFYVFFTRGGEEYKPSNIYKKFRDINPTTFIFDYSEYIHDNERLYYTGMLKALLHPLGGGKKRRTRRRRKNIK